MKALDRVRFPRQKEQERVLDQTRCFPRRPATLGGENSPGKAGTSVKIAGRCRPGGMPSARKMREIVERPTVMAQVLQRALKARVTPGGVLGCHPNDEPSQPCLRVRRAALT